MTVYHDNIKVQFIRSNNGGKGGDSVGGFSLLFLLNSNLQRFSEFNLPIVTSP